MVWTSPSKPWDLCSADRQAKLRAAWGSGLLRWKLDPNQQGLYDLIYASHSTVKSSAERIFCLDMSRQCGKDFLMSCIVIEQCLRNRRQIRIPYGCPTQETLHDLLVPTMFQIFQDCPPELLPLEIRKGTFRTTAHTLSWPWGAQIVLAGTDLHPDWLRGPASEIWALTEPGFMPELDGLMQGVLLPQTLTHPNGFGIMGSTPPETPGHAWTQKYLPAAKTRNMYAKRTIYDCPRFTPEQVSGFMKEYGGPTATRVRREFLCEHIVEATLAVMPEFSEVKDQIVTTEGFDKPPAFRDTYVALDPGFSHATGGLFGYLDFERALFMIEGDFAVRGLNSTEVARYIKAREWQLWGRPPVKPSAWTAEAWEAELVLMRGLFYPGLPVSAPVVSYRDGQVKDTTFRRVSDVDNRLIADMAREHGINISPTEKDDAEAALNVFRINMQKLKYRIHPRCVNAIDHFEQAIWNRGRTKIAESAAGGHFDCLPAGVYLNRNILWGRNPMPPTTYSHHTHFVPSAAKPMSKTAEALNRLFGKRR